MNTKINSPYIIEENDILVSTWGYEQTNATFYKVMKRTAKTVTLQKIGSERKESARTMTGTAVPDPSKTDGKPFRKGVYSYDGQEYVRIESYERAEKWTGKPVHISSYA